MKKSRISLIIAIGMIFVLLAGTTVYAVLRDNDPNRYFTGLGEHISMAPDDSKIAFSYYVDGEESVYTANPDGQDVKKITDSNGERDRNPKYAPDGKRLVYLSKDSEGIQTLKMTSEDGSEGKQLTKSDLHVTDALFSRDGESVFFVAIEADEFKKGEESREGFDLFSIKADGKQMEKLTNADYFSMNDLFLSPDGKTIYFNEFSANKEQIYSYALKNGKVNENPSLIPEKLAAAQSFYEPQLSPDGKRLAYTEVSKESENSSLYEYELFLLDVEKKKTERLTNLYKAVTSPVFFNSGNKLAFLENTNWASSPAEYRLMTIDPATYVMKAVKLDAPQSKDDHRFMRMLDQMVNMYTIAVLYILLMGLLSVYILHYYNRDKVYLPSIISFALAFLTLVASFATAALGNAWSGIGLGMIAAGILACSIVIILLVFVYKRFVR